MVLIISLEVLKVFARSCRCNTSVSWGQVSVHTPRPISPISTVYPSIISKLPPFFIDRVAACGVVYTLTLLKPSSYFNDFHIRYASYSIIMAVVIGKSSIPKPPRLKRLFPS
jgi:hypothetical protein